MRAGPRPHTTITIGTITIATMATIMATMTMTTMVTTTATIMVTGTITGTTTTIIMATPIMPGLKSPGGAVARRCWR